MAAQWKSFFIVLTDNAVVSTVSARVCTLMIDLGSRSCGQRMGRFVLPPGDPCTCTGVRLGGHYHRYAPEMQGQDPPLYMDMLPEVTAEVIGRWFNCTASKPVESTLGVTETAPELTSKVAPGSTPVASTPTDTTPVVSTTPEPSMPPADCQVILDAGQNSSGVYTIQHARQIMQVYCRMEPESGKGYIVFQRRLDGTVSFNRTWQEYAEGFGNLTGEFWLGNQKLHSLTGNGSWELVITLRAFDGDEARVRYQNFEIHSHSYWLDVSGFNDESGDAECGISLGMENGSIPDSAISASSRYTDGDSSRSTDNCQASHGRLNYLGTSGGITGGWCPCSKPDSWLQVDLGWRLQVEGVIIQGSFDPLETWSEWVTEYQVQYSDDQSNWQYVIQSTGTSPQTFPGNIDQTTPVTSMFDQPIRARFIRIRPTAYNRWPSMRMELIGCKITGDSLGRHSSGNFSSPDKDHDQTDGEKCAEKFQGGWWYKSCDSAISDYLTSNLNGVYYNNATVDDYMGIQWVTWKGKQVSLKWSEMMTRRRP
ncbi:uncharacterized protein LOC119737907 [Patiria miniata]|uniref:Fibrinogen C-terminal domain-containing protein n=1 Tax=Patiria miniata TaxID=46514 RepID=A0A914AYZ4_PATMI|nr:uncharacterized protein LOC119737907 [Patiria miniata]